MPWANRSRRIRRLAANTAGAPSLHAWSSSAPGGSSRGSANATARAHAGKGREPRGKREARLAERRKRAGIPKRFLGATVQHQDLIDYLESFEGSAGRGLYIYGSVGRGKSYSAAALANAFVDAGYRTVFTTASAMLERIKASFSGNGETDSVISRYAACDVLVLDDLGKEDAKEWSSNMMFLVINARYENMRPTIFTSNYSPQALSKRLGRKGETETAEAIASRLSETTIPIHLTGPDMRIASRM